MNLKLIEKIRNVETIKRITDLKKSLKHIEKHTGYLDTGESRKIIFRRFSYILISLSIFILIIYIITYIYPLQFYQAIINTPGTYGAILLA